MNKSRASQMEVTQDGTRYVTTHAYTVEEKVENYRLKVLLPKATGKQSKGQGWNKEEKFEKLKGKRRRH